MINYLTPFFNNLTMVKHKREHSANFLPFKFRRTKPAIGAEHRRRTDPNILASRRLTQVGSNTCSSNILAHPVDPELPVQINVFTYDENVCTAEKYNRVTDIPDVPLESTSMMWIDVDGVHQRDIIAELGLRYEIHPLVQTDMTTIEQRTKFDVLDDALFLVCKFIYRDIQNPEQVNVEQISFYVKENLLISLQETPKDFFDSIKGRLRHGRGRLRKLKVDYLFYSLVDVIVDNYMDILDTLGTKVEEIDQQLMKTLKRDTLESIYDIKRAMLYLRSVIYPLREIIIKLQKEDDLQIIQESTIIYLKDLFDHVIQVNDSIDTYREMLASFVDFYMMLNSNKMNQIVKTLTIISTIFIPLTFISGVYGMNFQNMPELRYKYGYYIVLAVMAFLGIFMLSCFKRKHWF